MKKQSSAASRRSALAFPCVLPLTDAPGGNTLALEDDTCKLTLRLVGDFLVADDNGDCGGVNVTFDGVYRKKKSRAHAFKLGTFNLELST